MHTFSIHQVGDAEVQFSSVQHPFCQNQNQNHLGRPEPEPEPFIQRQFDLNTWNKV